MSHFHWTYVKFGEIFFIFFHFIKIRYFHKVVIWTILIYHLINWPIHLLRSVSKSCLFNQILVILWRWCLVGLIRFCYSLKLLKVLLLLLQGILFIIPWFLSEYIPILPCSTCSPIWLLWTIIARFLFSTAGDIAVVTLP